MSTRTNQSVLSSGSSSFSSSFPTSPSSPPTSIPAERASSHVNTGAIAGGVLGGLAFLFGLLALLYFACWRKGTKSSHPSVVPFLDKRRPHMTDILPTDSPRPLVDEEKDVNDSTPAVHLPKGYFPPPPGTSTGSDMNTLAPPPESTNPPTEIEESRPLVQSQLGTSLEETIQALRAELQALRAASASGTTETSRSITSGIPSFVDITQSRPTNFSVDELKIKQGTPALPTIENRTLSTLAQEMQALRAEVAQLRHQPGSASSGPREAMEMEAGLVQEIAALRSEVEEMRMQQLLERGTLPSYSPPTRPIPGIVFVGPTMAP
jgi:ribosomal protein L29